MNEARKVVFGPSNDSLREIFVDGVHFGTCEFDFNADCFWMHGEDPEANYGRTFEEGKKISWKDGVRAIYCILKYGIFRFN